MSEPVSTAKTLAAARVPRGATISPNTPRVAAHCPRQNGQLTSVLRLKFRWLILLVYAMADFGEVVSERVQDLIGGLGQRARPCGYWPGACGTRSPGGGGAVR